MYTFTRCCDIFVFQNFPYEIPGEVVLTSWTGGRNVSAKNWARSMFILRDACENTPKWSSGKLSLTTKLGGILFAKPKYRWNNLVFGSISISPLIHLAMFNFQPSEYVWQCGIPCIYGQFDRENGDSSMDLGIVFRQTNPQRLLIVLVCPGYRWEKYIKFLFLIWSRS